MSGSQRMRAEREQRASTAAGGHTTMWTKEVYEKSVSSRCWCYTPYDAGWDESHRHGPDMRADNELEQIVAMERALGGVPEWAQRVVETSINFLPPCGHYLFPGVYLEAVSAIGEEAPPTFVHACYAVERERKERMTDYLFCLDAWLAGAAPEEAAGELEARGRTEVDWQAVCADLWNVLGERTETKELLVERTLHRQRWWLKSTVWDDDARDVFCRDQYLGEVRCSRDHYGNPAFRDPYFAESKSHRIQRVEARLAEICQDWEWFKDVIDWSWLCAPKAFRFLEGLLWSIGKERPAVSLPSYPLENPEQVPGFLRCEDTYPDREQASRWSQSFLAALLGLALVMAIPFLWMVSASLMGEFEAYSFPHRLWPEHPRWQNYTEALTALPFGRFFLNTILMGVGMVCGQLLICSAAAYAFARLRFPGRRRRRPRAGKRERPPVLG